MPLAFRNAAAVLVAVAACALGAPARGDGAGGGPAGAGEASATLIVCYPNAPGSTESARPVMQRLGEHLAARGGTPCTAAYTNDAALARAWIDRSPPRFAILSLELFLRWREPLGLTPLALSERDGVIQERFHLLVPAGAPHARLEDLADLDRPAVVRSPHVEEARFARAILFGGRLDVRAQGEEPAAAWALATDQPLRVLRRMIKGEPFQDLPVDAVLVDDTTWSGLQQLKSFQGALRVLYTTPALPTAPVVAFPGAPPEARRRITAALAGMASDATGKKLLETLQVTGFRPAATEGDALAPLVQRYEAAR